MWSMSPSTLARRRRTTIMQYLCVVALMAALLCVSVYGHEDVEYDHLDFSGDWESSQLLGADEFPFDSFEEDHDPAAFLELEAELEVPDMQAQHLENLLALQDKYANAPASPSSITPEAEEPQQQLEHLEDQHLLVETQQHAGAEGGLGGGVGLSVGASAEVQAAIAAGVDMSSESQMEAQLESLAAAQQSTDQAASESQAAAQTKNLLSFFWGKTPHKVWQDKADWQSKAARQAANGQTYIHPHKFEYLKAAKKIAPDAKLPAAPAPVSRRGGRLPGPVKAEAKSVTTTPAFEEFQRNTVNGRPRYIHKPGKLSPVYSNPVQHSRRISPPAIGQKEVFWLSLGEKQFAFNGAKGRSYPFNSVGDAKSACLAVGADLASRSQLKEAYDAGAEWCACGALAEGSFGFPMQRRVNGCGTGPGTNEVCRAGGAKCYGYKPTRSSLSALPGTTVAPFKPQQWFQDAFAGLNEKCLHKSPWNTKECLQAAWKIAGCTRRGTRYPSTQASTVLWNQMSTWTEVVADMKAIANNDVSGGSTANQCKGPREVFFYTAGPKRFIWNGQSGDGYPYNTRVQAEEACKSIGATLATKAQLQEAWKDGAEWCMCGALADDDRWSFPMHHALKGCGSKKGVIRTCSAGGATCYGVKPSRKRVPGISPFKPGQYHQDRWTPLVKKCSHEPPYSLSKCIRPAWKLAGCTKLGKDYPKRNAPILDQWNRMSWDSVREDILNRARNDAASCSSKFAVLDSACNHPPPYSTKRCLQKALKLAGCDETGFLWPSASHTSKTSHKANLWWNHQKWNVVVEDIQNWAEADLVQQNANQRGGCQGLKETFWYSGTSKASYQFINSGEAAKACESIGAVLATKQQVEEAFELGAEWCAAGFTTDGEARYPIQTPRKGCAAKKGVAVWEAATKGGATCYGFKPSVKDVPGILPFHPKGRYSAVREWKITPTTKCTKQCGSGTQLRKVRCINSLTGVVRPEHTCASLGPKPEKKAFCNVAPCEYDWKKSAWTDCSQSCDGGVQTRTMRCIQASSGNEFPDEKCLRLGELKPKTERTCNTHTCVSFQWKLAPFGACSKECVKGSETPGKQTRKVMCLGSDGKLHADDRCLIAGGQKPAVEQSCNSHTCPDYSWKKGSWNTCSLSCNGGKTQRSVQCIGTDGAIAPDAKCLALSSLGGRPRTEKPCNTQACLLYNWNRAPWSNCTRSCGGGSSTRIVTCQDSLNRTVAEGACSSAGPAPRTVKGCNTIPCRDFNWFTHKWSDCSTSCGGGSQTRQVDCVGDDGSLAKDAQCINAGPKKDTKQACNVKPCVTLAWTHSGASASLLEIDGPVDNTTVSAEGWGPCSEPCGLNGWQTRQYSCKASDGSSRDAKACEVVLGPSPSVRQACNTQPCITYDFQPTAWGDCSLSCGGGLSVRKTPCVGSDGDVVADSLCTKQGLLKPKAQKACNTRPCEGFTWSVGTYSDCDASCGGGLQTRKVTCTGSSGKVYDDRHCAQVGYDKPESARPCNSHRCVEKKWRIGTWDSCDRSCGGGETHRSVACFGTDGKSYSDQDCLDSYRQRNATLTKQENQKPRVQKSCNTQSCISYFWDVADWQRCNARCGGGMQQRRVVCMSTDGTEKSDALCAALASKPASQQICNVNPCATYKLEVGPWETCSQSCGGGSQNRTVTCVSSKGVRITDLNKFTELCPAAPDLEQQCNTQACVNKDEKGWVVKEWSQCDSKCGGGVQQRLVQCVSQIDKTCATFGERPVAERACNIQPCTIYEWDVSEWSECSRSCGNNGVQRRTVSCKGTDGSLHNSPSKCKDSGKQPSATKPCDQNPCLSYYWKASDWKACSRSCAKPGEEGGIATREVYCQGSDGAKRTDDACATQGAKPENTKTCNTAACENYEFKIGEWESCTRGCSTGDDVGTQSRSVECRSTTTQKLVETSKCLVGDAEAPITKRQCNTTPCITYYWQLGEFGECSNVCDGGHQTRTVTCMGSDGAKYKDDFCLTYSYKAPTQAVCNTKPCGNFTWAPEPVWSSCSVSCDSGIQTRPIRCVGPDGNNWPRSVCANTSLALGAPPQEPAQECNTHACMTTMWDVTPFSKCTRHCGGGRQVRAVTCRKADGTRIPDRVCARLSPKPTETATCNTAACPTYQWVADEFDDCSVNCGGGVQTREVRCENNFGSRVSNRHCYRLGLERPVPSEACNVKPCGTASSWTIDPWQTCSVECGGGMRIRSVHCRVGNNSTDKHCQSILPMPTTTEQCNTHPCITYKYEASPWSICSTSCDDLATMQIRNTTQSIATQSRQLRCLASDGSYSSLARCAQFLGAASLPATSRPCKTNQPCERYRWVFGKWAKCDRKCGSKGSQRRAVYCADDKNRKVKKSLCVFSGPKPYSARRCNSHRCVRKYSWQKQPWRECSKQCGAQGGIKLRDVHCVDRFGTRVTKQACELTVGPSPRLSKVCNKKPCVSYKWSFKPFSECSKWCGRGSQSREITCAGSDGRVHKDIYCVMTNGEKAETERVCNTVPCVYGKWKKAPEWTECTRSCGGGTRTRTVACVGSDGSVLPDKACEKDGTRPVSQSVCNKQKCLSTSWFVGTWGTCDRKCAAADGTVGKQTREVACIASDGVVKADVACAYAGPKATLSQECNTTPCSALVRQYTPFSDCTSSCNGGTQTRTQQCYNTLTNSLAATPSDCDHVPVEELSRKCNTQACLTYQWKIAKWSECSVLCGGGEKSREVTCVGSDGSVVADDVCLKITAKPDVKRSCHSTPCDSAQLYGWKVNEWGVCSQDCGGGKATRTVTCTRKASGEVVEDKLCTAKPPPLVHSCNTAKCDTGAVNHWKIVNKWTECSKSCGGGEQTREVVCSSPTGTYLDNASCSRSGVRPKSKRWCNLFECSAESFKTADYNDASESDRAELAERQEEARRDLWEKMNPGKEYKPRKSRKPKPPTHTLYKHRKRRSLAQGLAEFKNLEKPDGFSSSEPSIITGGIGSAGHAPKWAHAGLGIMKQEDQKAMFDVTFGVHDPELKEAMNVAAKEAMKHNDLDARFDSHDASGKPRTEGQIAARKALRAALVKARARPGMSDEEDSQERYDRFDRSGKPRSLKEIEERQAIRSRRRIVISKEDELKEIYDLYLPNGLPRPAAEIAARKARRLAAAKAAEKADPNSEMYDAVDPKTGRARTASEIKHRQLIRTKHMARKVARELAQAKLAQIEARRRAATRATEAAASAPKLNRFSPMKSTGDLPPYNEDGSCSDTRGCILSGGDDSKITSDQAIKMLPVVPQFKDPVVDEYEA